MIGAASIQPVIQLRPVVVRMVFKGLEKPFQSALFPGKEYRPYRREPVKRRHIGDYVVYVREIHAGLAYPRKVGEGLLLVAAGVFEGLDRAVGIKARAQLEIVIEILRAEYRYGGAQGPAYYLRFGAGMAGDERLPFAADAVFYGLIHIAPAVVYAELQSPLSEADRVVILIRKLEYVREPVVKAHRPLKMELDHVALPVVKDGVIRLVLDAEELRKPARPVWDGDVFHPAGRAAGGVVIARGIKKIFLVGKMTVAHRTSENAGRSGLFRMTGVTRARRAVTRRQKYSAESKLEANPASTPRRNTRPPVS